MIVSNEHRSQYLYFLLSGIVASVIFLLVYFSAKTTMNDKLRDDIHEVQKTLKFIKPSASWQYNNSWKRIGNAMHRHSIFSAYFDPRLDVIDHVSNEPMHMTVGSIRIFALLPMVFPDARLIKCIIRFEDFTLSEVKTQNANPIFDEYAQEMPFGMYSIACPLHVNRNQSFVNLPQSVAIAYPSNPLSFLSPTFVAISYPRDMSQLFTKSRPVLSVCVGMLENHLSDVARVAEFVEMYRIMGARHFYFYNVKASDDVLSLLNYYRNAGIVDALDWNLLDSTNDVPNGGIMAQFNDCIYRTMVVDNYRYAVVVNLDEILIPLKHNSLANMLQQCDEGRTSAFVFRNVFLHKKDRSDTFSIPNHVRNRFLYTQTKVHRAVDIMPAYAHSRCIVNTHSIIEMGNHQVWRATSGYTDSIVNPTVGLLFHYRDKCINCKMILTVDYTARRYGSLIWDKVDEVCNHVFVNSNGICANN